MTEHLNEKAEIGHEQLDLHESNRHNLERLQKEAEAEEHNHNIGEIQKSIHKEAQSAKEITIGEKAEDSSGKQIFGAQKELKADAYRRTVHKVRGHLRPAERALSKVIHSDVMEPINEISSKTLARPSGVLGGGIAALVGSGFILYLAKRYGFRYNFTTFLILLVFGFVTGLTVEALVRLVRRKRT